MEVWKADVFEEVRERSLERFITPVLPLSSSISHLLQSFISNKKKKEREA
jgi:hypothetical protein